MENKVETADPRNVIWKKKKIGRVRGEMKVRKKDLIKFPHHFQIAVAGLETVLYSTLVIRVVHHPWKKFRAWELVILLLVLQTES